jgi:pilus assembly protein TadC
VFCLAGAAFLLGEIVTAPSRQRYLSVRRAATYGKMELPSGTPNEGLRERVVAPLSDVLSKWALKINPRSSKDSVGRRLMAAGVGYRISPTGYLALKALLALVGCFVGSMLGASRGFSGIVIGALMAGALGFLGPDYALTLKARGRKEKVRADLPDALDLLAVSVEAGLGFDASLAKLNEHMDGPLAEEFGLTLSEMRIGESRSEALKRMSDRVDAPELSAFTRAIIQADQSRNDPGPDPPRPGCRRSSAQAGGRRGAGDEGADQDALPDGALHLPGDVPRHPRAAILNVQKIFG